MATRMRVRGVPQLQNRLRLIKTAFKPIGRQWGTATARNGRRTNAFRDRTGRGRKSIRLRTATTKRATVVATYYIAILDKGSRQHTIVPRKARRLAFQSDGNTVFARKVTKPAARGLGFGKIAGRKALREVPYAAELVRLWNQGG